MTRHQEYIEPIKDLLPPEALIVKDDQGEPPVHFAVYLRFLGQIKYLLTKDGLSIETTKEKLLFTGHISSGICH